MRRAVLVVVGGLGGGGVVRVGGGFKPSAEAAIETAPGSTLMPDKTVQVGHPWAVGSRKEEVGVRAELPTLIGIPDLKAVVLEGREMGERWEEERVDILRLVGSTDDAARQYILLLVASI